MKNKYLILSLFAVLAIGIFSAFNRNADLPNTPEMAAEYAAGVGEYSVFDYRMDTLTNANTATINIGRRDNSVWNTVTTPTNFLSLYTYDIKCRPVSLSGTISVKLVLDASNMRSGTSTDWCAIDSITGTTSARVLQLRSTDATATRYRIRVIGAGTQSSQYTIRTTWKKKN